MYFSLGFTVKASNKMSVHPQAQVLLDLLAQRPRPQPTDVPLEEFRALIEKLSK